MLKPELFIKGENDVQFYYFMKNEVVGELVQIIRNKREEHWFGMYDGKDGFFTIPVHVENEPDLMLEKVCEWYNNGKQKPYYQEVEEANPKRISKSLLEIENIFGVFPLESAKRIQAYIDNPTVERWDDISGIIITGGFTTVWQAILEQDPTFPRSGRTTDITGKVVSEWARIPEPLEVLRAIKKKVKEEQ